MQAKRLIFPSERKVEIETFELPEKLEPDQVLMENVVSLISPGTELAMYTKTHVGFANPNNKYAKYPFKAGYATVGRVMKTGSNAAASVKEGELIMHRGGHASHFIGNIHPDQWSMFERVPAGVEPKHAIFCVMAEISLTSVLLSRIVTGMNVAVFGQGLVGNFAAQIMRVSGGRKVVVLDPVAQRLETSRKCGLALQVDPTAADWKTKLSEITGKSGCQIVVEATGNPNVAVQALSAAAQRGRVILLGSPRGTATIDLYNQIHAPCIEVIGAHGNALPTSTFVGAPPTVQIVLEYIVDGRLTVAPLITHTLTPAQADVAYKGLLEKSSEYLGVLLDLSKW